ncbi:putative metallophosphoesterase YhaO [Clostridium sp. N3C]|uniref:metallophosphoesterase family protein n=1 Tax=Clostridium sp. N3C TaxID=1776758 RepID=UPI00092DEE40|nr:DNA repair exonuclease [Clostridium sp. N3C]SCN23260.1 putative metallophosphoesterase YhaO [Clostridium sp. N3C]
MSTVKIIHCSDFHFDTPFKEYEKNMAEKRKEDLRETFANIIKMAKDEGVQFILISGDIFDNSTVTYETIKVMKKYFEQVSHIHIFISAGNHDPLDKNSYYNTVSWPENVHIFGTNMEKIALEELGVCVYGRSFGSTYEREGLLKNFTVEDPSKINIMVMHGDVVQGNGSSDYNPIMESDIYNSGLDYLALGHIHKYSGIQRNGKTYWSYSGCVEGRGFDELGPKGIVIGEVGKGFVKLGFQEICKRRLHELQVEISGVENYDDILLEINKKLGLHDEKKDKAQILDDIRRDIYKIVLKGQIDEEFIINKSVLEDKLKESFYYVKIVDLTEAKIDYKSLAQEYNLKGVFVKKILEKLSLAEDEEEKEKLKMALRMGVEALDYRVVRKYED